LLHSIRQISELLRQGSLSPVELTEDCLARIEMLNPRLNAFITVTVESARAQARQAEAAIRRGDWRGPLHGIPIALKDIIDTAAVRTTAASCLFKDRVPSKDAEVVRRLKEAGAVLLGKQNLHEFAYGGSSMVSYFGAVRNAWNTGHVAGGSSGGSAAAVAAGLGFGAIGTDTAGSVREPAALCGVVGLKPTYGRVSAQGVIPLSVSLDHVGPIARTVADAAIILQAIAGFDANDKASADVPVEDYVAALGTNLEPLRIGIPKKFFFEDLEADVSSAMKHVLSGLEAMGAELRDVELTVPTDRTLQSAESYAFHAEFIARNPEMYQPETLRRIRSGEKTSPEKILECRRELERTRRDVVDVFDNVDLLVTPTTPATAPAI
jgi:aspartyl-tRNA(Asn)/glutamyl-tRNA(Gln) amidotransferase subunit A